MSEVLGGQEQKFKVIFTSVYVVSKTRNLVDGFGRHDFVCFAGSTRERALGESVRRRCRSVGIDEQI